MHDRDHRQPAGREPRGLAKVAPPIHEQVGLTQQIAPALSTSWI